MLTSGNHKGSHCNYFVRAVKPYRAGFIKIIIPQEKLRKIDTFVELIVEKKLSEKQYQIDGRSMRQRYRTGLMGEAALEELLGVPIIDWSIGSSNYYNVPDLKSLGIRVGVKTVECYKFPLINKYNTYPQIINIRMNDCTVYICGLALPKDLNTYQDDRLVKDKRILLKNNKSAFWNFGCLHSLCMVNKPEALSAYLNFLGFR